MFELIQLSGKREGLFSHYGKKRRRGKGKGKRKTFSKTGNYKRPLENQFRD